MSRYIKLEESDKMILTGKYMLLRLIDGKKKSIEN